MPVTYDYAEGECSRGHRVTLVVETSRQTPWSWRYHAITGDQETTQVYKHNLAMIYQIYCAHVVADDQVCEDTVWIPFEALVQVTESNPLRAECERRLPPTVEEK